MDAWAIRDAADELQNPLGRETPERVRTVLKAAEKLADVIDIMNMGEDELGDANEWASAIREDMIRELLGLDEGN